MQLALPPHEESIQPIDLKISPELQYFLDIAIASKLYMDCNIFIPTKKGSAQGSALMGVLHGHPGQFICGVAEDTDRMTIAVYDRKNRQFVMTEHRDFKSNFSQQRINEKQLYLKEIQDKYNGVIFLEEGN